MLRANSRFIGAIIAKTHLVRQSVRRLLYSQGKTELSTSMMIVVSDANLVCKLVLTMLCTSTRTRALRRSAIIVPTGLSILMSRPV